MSIGRRRAAVSHKRCRDQERKEEREWHALGPSAGSKWEAGSINARVEAGLMPGPGRPQRVDGDEPAARYAQEGMGDPLVHTPFTSLSPSLPSTPVPSPPLLPLHADSGPAASPPPTFPPYGDTPPTSPNRLIIRSSAYYRVPPPTPICLSRPSSPVLGLGHALRPAIVEKHCTMDPCRYKTLGPALIFDGHGDSECWDGVLHWPAGSGALPGIPDTDPTSSYSCLDH